MNTPNTRNPWIMPLGPVAIVTPDGSLCFAGLEETEVVEPTESGKQQVTSAIAA